MLYMVVEKFRNADPVPVYRRFRECGRLAPEGLRYVSSWVDEKLQRCFQLMETDDRLLLDEWMDHWTDLVEFEVYPVVSSAEAAERIMQRTRVRLRP
jgi:uncharacterized protein DUF3303